MQLQNRGFKISDVEVAHGMIKVAPESSAGSSVAVPDLRSGKHKWVSTIPERLPLIIMPTISERMIALSSTIEEIRSISGTAGLCLSVLHQGRIVQTANFGYRDVETQLPVTENTIFGGASLTKAMICAALGVLVEEKKLKWSLVVSDVLPEFRPVDDCLRCDATVEDFLTHRSRIQSCLCWLGSHNNILVGEDDSMRYLNSQNAVAKLRERWQYNNLGYEIAGHVIEQVTERPWTELLRSRIFGPLGLHRTGFGNDIVDDDSVSCAYTCADDASPIRIDNLKLDDKTFGCANGGVRTCVSDLLVIYRSLLRAYKHQSIHGTTTAPANPFVRVSELFSGRGSMESQSSRNEGAYALGWVRVQLPARMGAIGPYFDLMPEGMPLVGKGAKSQIALYHQGSLPGALASVILLPESESAIVVLTNSLALTDCADWVGQLVLETLIEARDPNDYVQLARDGVKAALGWFPRIRDELQATRPNEPPSHNFSAYTGTYVDAAGIMRLVVSLNTDELQMAFLGLDSETFRLTHLGGDIFHWLQPRETLAARGRFTNKKASHYRIEFKTAGEDGVYGLIWARCGDLPSAGDRALFRRL